MAKTQAVDRLISMLDDGLAKLPPVEQRRVLREGAELLDSRRAQLSKPEEPANAPAAKAGRTRAAR